MKETKSYWYHNMAYSMEPYCVCLHFSNLIMYAPKEKVPEEHSPKQHVPQENAIE